MKHIVAFFLLAILPLNSKAEEDGSTQPGRFKRDIWLEEPLPNTEGSKYSWLCRECDVHKTRSPDANGCEEEAATNGETYSLNACSGKQVCEMLLRIDWSEESNSGPIANLLTGIIGHRYCCDKHQICNIKNDANYTEYVCNQLDVFTEYSRRSCCEQHGISCDKELNLPDGAVKNCELGATCENWTKSPLGGDCCQLANLSCTVPTCEFKTCGSNGECLTPWEYGKCCAFYNSCDGILCPDPGLQPSDQDFFEMN